jgi:hypothetical protein
VGKATQDIETPGADRRRPRRRLLLLAIILVVVVLAAATVVSLTLLGGKPDRLASTASPSPSTAPRRPPTLHIGARTVSTVRLSWREPSEARQPETYRVIRDGDVLTTVPADSSTYVDSSLWPATTYRYRVVAVFDHGQAASRVLSATTVTPPTWRGRLQGSYTVTYTVSSSSLTGAHPGQPLRNYTWTFDPGCGSGPCGGKWTIEFGDGSHAAGHIQLRAQSYVGGMTSQPLGTCGSTTTEASATLSLRITKSAPRFGEWRVVTFTGTIREYFPAGNGCVAGFLNATVTGVSKRA